MAFGRAGSPAVAVQCRRGTLVVYLGEVGSVLSMSLEVERNHLRQVKIRLGDIVLVPVVEELPAMPASGLVSSHDGRLSE